MTYGWFFWVAFTMAIVWLWSLGWVRNLPAGSWATLLLMAVVFGLIGSKVATTDAQDWLLVFHGKLPHLFWNKSWFGGLALGSLAVSLARRKLGLQRAALDLLVVPVFVAMAVGRVGCLVGGCCTGTPTDLPWAMHRVRGVGVHPVPVYEMLFAVTLVVVLLGTRRKRLRPGQPFALALAAYFGFRFLEEFVRPGFLFFAGLKTTQWVALLLLVFWLRQFVVDFVSEEKPVVDTTGFGVSLALVMALAVGYGLILATPLEQLVLATTFGLVMTLTFVQEWFGRRAWPESVRVLPAVPLICGVVALGLGLPASDDTLKNVEKSWRVGFGALAGHYEETCGGEHDVGVGALAVERVLHEANGTEGRAGLQVYAGRDRSRWQNLPIFVLNPYACLDSRWLGFWGGVYAGNVVVDGHRAHATGGFGLRLGPRDLMFVHGGVAEPFPAGFPLPWLKLGLGFGLGELGQFRFGISYYTGWYVEPRLNLPAGLRMRMLLSFAPKTASGMRPYQISLGISTPIRRQK